MKTFKLLLFLSFTFLFILSASAQDQAFEKYTVRNFSFQGHAAKVVFPNQANENGYWVWRARFWGHEPQLDKALLEKGFHVVYVDVADLYGNEEAVKIWDAFYAYCRTEFKLNEKVVLEGMSRGGLIIYNWAAKNTDKVFTIYADAPVCDIKSWPGGLYSGKGSPTDWEKCLKAYGLDATSVLDFKGIPIYNSIAIAKAGIPVIHVYGEADEVVPASENTDLLAAEFRKAGGTIKLIGKPGVGHHPHSLEDPTPILDFIMESIKGWD
ncbi:alpha/beta hydrolase family protein [Algoriphagus aquimarinus]|uniref:Alpha/beta hydrolase n=1 Tax=Algoriphagus aquimarinus TaxID=237018 RepID=A0A5C7AC64_9BACT|nr:alpha/beta hydrolase [Algoriphagus aquimarinus]TXE03735.1 alpha/beta hydrolase [Algoriphagus aquimarinus]